jgi:nicotinate-nucleotide adenylyltransferase
MRIGLFGGTFNPVHNGHLLIAEAAREKYRLDQILFIPAGLPPHKKAPRTPVRHRLAMLRLATRGNAAFAIDPWEIKQGRVVYTYQTLEHAKAKWPKAALYFLLGADAMKTVPKWVESARVRKLAKLLPAPRLSSFASHDIRARVEHKQSIRYLVPTAVESYIRRHRLYRRPE